MVKQAVVLCVWLLCLARPEAATELTLKANFVYRFAQFTQWPPPPRTATHYCIAEYPQLLAALRALPHKPAPLLQMADLNSDLSQCELLVLGTTERSRLQLWQQKLQGHALLVVTDNAEAYRQLGMIKLQTSPDGVQFLINLRRAQQHQLQLSAHLLKLALEVH